MVIRISVLAEREGLYQIRNLLYDDTPEGQAKSMGGYGQLLNSAKSRKQFWREHRNELTRVETFWVQENFEPDPDGTPRYKLTFYLSGLVTRAGQEYPSVQYLILDWVGRVQPGVFYHCNLLHSMMSLSESETVRVEVEKPAVVEAFMVQNCFPRSKKECRSMSDIKSAEQVFYRTESIFKQLQQLKKLLISEGTQEPMSSLDQGILEAMMDCRIGKFFSRWEEHSPVSVDPHLIKTS